MINEMSYESRMLARLAMPTRTQVGHALLQTLLKNGGVVKEFGAGQEVVDQLADRFQLNRAQGTATLETVYRKEDRVKKSLLWHRHCAGKWRPRILFLALRSVEMTFSMESPCAGSITGRSTSVGFRCSMITRLRFHPILTIFRLSSGDWEIMS